MATAKFPVQSFSIKCPRVYFGFGPLGTAAAVISQAFGWRIWFFFRQLVSLYDRSWLVSVELFFLRLYETRQKMNFSERWVGNDPMRHFLRYIHTFIWALTPEPMTTSACFNFHQQFMAHSILIFRGILAIFARSFDNVQQYSNLCLCNLLLFKVKTATNSASSSTSSATSSASGTSIHDQTGIVTCISLTRISCKVGNVAFSGILWQGKHASQNRAASILNTQVVASMRYDDVYDMSHIWGY